MGGAAAQLGLNLVALFLGGIARLYEQHRVYALRRKRHLLELSREAPGGALAAHAPQPHAGASSSSSATPAR